MVEPVGADSDFVVASDRRDAVGACHCIPEKEETRQTHQTLAIALRRLLISVVVGNRKGCDPAHVDSRLWVNTKEIAALKAEKKD